MSVRTERRLTIERGSPMSHHSMNQRIIRAGLEGERRIFGVDNKKLARSERRKEKEESRKEGLEAQHFIPELLKTQFERSLERVISENATPEDVKYFLGHESQFGQIVDDQVTIVDIVSKNGKL